jgi:hypothetical protein
VVPSDAGGHTVAGMEGEQMSLGEFLFERQLSGEDYDECEHNFIASSLSSSDNRPLLNARLKNKEKEEVECVVLIDSGATSSFIDADYSNRNGFKLKFLENKLRCRLFDGSLASSGDIVHCVEGTLLLPLVSGEVIVSSVKLNVTKIASANVILGASWLRDSDCFVGGTNSNVVVNHFIQSSCSTSDVDVAKLMKKYSNVFVTKSLEGLPPHREHFDLPGENLWHWHASATPCVFTGTRGQ